MADNIPSIKELEESFAKVDNAAKLSGLQREIELVKEAQRFNISPETYRHFYEHRPDKDIGPFPRPTNWQRTIPEWSAWLVHLSRKKKLALVRKKIVPLVKSGVVITVIIALGQYILEIPARRLEATYHAWQIFNSAQGQIEAGRKEALQELRKYQNKDLEHLNVHDASLEKIELPNVNLQHSDLSEAILNGANFQGAKFDNSNLNGTFLKVANLQKAQFQKVDLRGADLEGADQISV